MQNTFKVTVAAFITIILVNCYLVKSDVSSRRNRPAGYRFCDDGSWISYEWTNGPIYDSLEKLLIRFRTSGPSGLLVQIHDPITPGLSTVVQTQSGIVYVTQLYKGLIIGQVVDKSVRINDNIDHTIMIHHGDTLSLQIDGNAVVKDANFEDSGGRRQIIGGNIDIGGCPISESSAPYLDFFNGTISRLVINDVRDVFDTEDPTFRATIYYPTRPKRNSVKNIKYTTKKFDPDEASSIMDDHLIVPICITNSTYTTESSSKYECDDEDCLDGSGSGSGIGEIPDDNDTTTPLPTTLVTSITTKVPSSTSKKAETTDFYWVTSSSETTSPETTTIEIQSPTTPSPSSISSTTEEQLLYTKHIHPDKASKTITPIIFTLTSSNTDAPYEETDTEDYLTTENPETNPFQSFLSKQLIWIIGFCVGLVLTIIVILYVLIVKCRSKKPKKAVA